mmetsp:Transcript_33488/g.70476  ORF Transcript_33488/g.70476 Transcript_33488/m.70476 type:complete len:219 (-) Transcript_33488:32-688(-)
MQAEGPPLSAISIARVCATTLLRTHSLAHETVATSITQPRAHDCGGHCMPGGWLLSDIGFIRSHPSFAIRLAASASRLARISASFSMSLRICSGSGSAAFCASSCSRSLRVSCTCAGSSSLSLSSLLLFGGIMPAVALCPPFFCRGTSSSSLSLSDDGGSMPTVAAWLPSERPDLPPPAGSSLPSSASGLLKSLRPPRRTCLPIPPDLYRLATGRGRG